MAQIEVYIYPTNPSPDRQTPSWDLLLIPGRGLAAGYKAKTNGWAGERGLLLPAGVCGSQWLSGSPAAAPASFLPNESRAGAGPTRPSRVCLWPSD